MLWTWLDGAARGRFHLRVEDLAGVFGGAGDALALPRGLDDVGGGTGTGHHRLVPDVVDDVAFPADEAPALQEGDRVRGLLLGTPIGNSAAIATAWCAVVSYLWAKNIFNKA